MKGKNIIAAVLILLTAGQLFGQDKNKPLVALVLAGGGALGFAHVGVLKVLEEEGIHPDMVIGASMGSIVGGLYSVGYSPGEMEKIIAGTDWREILWDSFDRRELSFDQKKRESLYNLSFGINDENRVADAGLSHGQHVVELLDKLLSPYGVETDFDSLPVPFRAVASDLVTGDKIVYDQGDLKTVIRASMAVPSIFTPLSYRGRYVIDGGWTENLPTTVAVEMGADIIIAVSLFSLGEDLEKLNSIGAVALQSDLIRTRERDIKSLEAADFVISPDLTGYNMASFDKGVPLMALGYEAADAKRQEIRELAASLGDPSPRMAREVRDERVRISRIRVEESAGQTASDIVLEAVESQIGHHFYLSELRECLYGLYDKGEFNHVWYQLVSEGNGSYELVVDAPLKVRLREQFSSSLEFSRQIIESHISLFTLKTAYQRWFGEDKTKSVSFELWFSDFPSLLISLDNQLMGRNAHLKAGGYMMGEPQYFYEGDSLDSLYGLNRLGGFLKLERPFFRRLEISLGGYSEYNWMNHSLGDKSLTEESWGRHGLTGVISVDTLDRVITPERGLHGVALLDSSMDDEGESLGLTKAAARLFLPLTDRLILIPRTEIQNLLWGMPRDIELPALGQSMEIHGYYPQELRGENVALFGMGFRLQIGTLPLGLGDEIYLQLAGNTATVWDDDVAETYSDFEFYRGAAAGIVVNFNIGELQLNTGLNEEGRWSTFLGLSTSPSFFGKFY